MPLYEFKCNKCGNRFEISTSMSQRDKVTCTKCDSKEVEQLFTGCSINTGSIGSDFRGCGGSGGG